MNLAELDFQKIFVWVAIWLFGYVLGLLENWVKDKAKNKKQEPEVKIVEAPPKLIEEDYALAVFEEGENIHLKLDREPLRQPDRLEPAQRERLISLIVKLRPWIQNKPDSSAPKPQPRPTRSAPQPAPTSAKTDLPSQPVETPNIPDDLEYSKLNLVGQIDWILQRKLENHPLKAKKIRLENTLTGGMRFCVGDETFEFIDEIPYPDVKAIIEEARSEWEKRSTPGL